MSGRKINLIRALRPRWIAPAPGLKSLEKSLERPKRKPRAGVNNGDLTVLTLYFYPRRDDLYGMQQGNRPLASPGSACLLAC